MLDANPHKVFELGVGTLRRWAKRRDRNMSSLPRPAMLSPTSPLLLDLLLLADAVPRIVPAVGPWRVVVTVTCASMEPFANTPVAIIAPVLASLSDRSPRTPVQTTDGLPEIKAKDDAHRRNPAEKKLHERAPFATC